MSDESNSPTIDSATDRPMTIEERLAYLEEQNEGLKTVGKLLLALSVITAGLLAWTQMNQRSGIFSESTIYESDGIAKAAITSNLGNHLALLSFDPMGILPTDPQFGAVGGLQGLVLYDRDGKPRVVIGINDRNESVLDVLGPDGARLFSAVPTTQAPPAAEPLNTQSTPRAPGAAPSTSAAPSAP